MIRFKHTRIFALTPEHLDVLLHRKIARDEAAIAQHLDRINQVCEFIRDQRANPWGSRLTVQALEEELDSLLNAEPEEEV